MPIPSKTEPAKVKSQDWQKETGNLRGLLEGKSLQTNVTLIRYVTDKVGEGPTLHVHPYDEIFTITEGRARFTVGDKVIDAEAGDIVFGPANVPHGYQNLGPGRLDSLDIHLSPEWIQFNLASAWDQSSVLISSHSKIPEGQNCEGNPSTE
ncbi:cupin domain-containing protein [Pirellulaceae bacterium SH501]